jgi:predicted transcriptional regulator
MSHAQRIRRQVRKGAVLNAVDGDSTTREVAERVDIPLSTVREYLRELADEGAIEQVGTERQHHGGGPAIIYAREGDR